MNNNLPTYYEYKETDQPWLGKIPEYWKVLPNRALFREINEKNHPEELMLSVTIDQGVIQQEELLADTSKKDSSRLDKSGYKLVCPGDIAYNKMRAWQGSIGVSDYKGIVSPAYIVQRLRGADDHRYYHYLFRTPLFTKEAERWSYGITSDMWSLRPEHFRMIYSPRPPQTEQRAIARYLDWADKRIQRLIEARERQIELLEEYKQAIIQQAVTGQMDVRTGEPYPKYKDSGVEWLGQVPEHWELTLGRKYFEEKQAVRNTGLVEENVLSLSYGKIIKKPQEKMYGLMPASFETYQIVDPGDVICRSTDLQNDQKSLRFGIVNQRGIITSAYLRLAAKEGLNEQFGYLLLHTYDIVKIIYKFGSGLRQNLSWHDFKRLPIAIPPTNEQHEIIEFIKKMRNKIEQETQVASKKIELLKEYRTRLIADVVTGKVDVRQAAANLPSRGDQFDNQLLDRVQNDLDGDNYANQ